MLFLCLFVVFTLQGILMGPNTVAAEEVYDTEQPNWSSDVSSTNGVPIWWQDCTGTPPDAASSVFMLGRGQTARFTFSGRSVQIYAIVLPVTTCSEDYQRPSISLNSAPPAPPPHGTDCVLNWYPTKCNTVVAEYSNLVATRTNTVFIAAKDAQVAILNAVVQDGDVSPPPPPAPSRPPLPTPSPNTSPSPPSPSHTPSSPSPNGSSSSTSEHHDPHSSSWTTNPYDSPTSEGIVSSSSTPSISVSSPVSSLSSRILSSSSDSLPRSWSSTVTSTTISESSTSLSTDISRHGRQNSTRIMIIVIVVVPSILLTGTILLWIQHRRKLAARVRSSNESFISKDVVGSGGWQKLPDTPGLPRGLDVVDVLNIVPGPSPVEEDPEAKSKSAASSSQSPTSTMRRLMAIRDSVRGSMLSASDVITLLNRFIVQSAPAIKVSFDGNAVPPKGITASSRPF